LSVIGAAGEGFPAEARRDGVSGPEKYRGRCRAEGALGALENTFVDWQPGEGPESTIVLELGESVLEGDGVQPAFPEDTMKGRAGFSSSEARTDNRLLRCQLSHCFKPLIREIQPDQITRVKIDLHSLCSEISSVTSLS